MNWKQAVADLIGNSKEAVVKIDLDTNSIKYNSKIKLHRDITKITGDEEIVRAYLVDHLVNQLDYNAELIEIEKGYEAGRPKKITPRIDVILKDSKNNAFFFIEAKAPDKFESDKDYIEGQLFKLAKLEGAVRYLVYYTVEYQNDCLVDKAIIIDFDGFPDYNSWMEEGFPSIANELPAQYNKPQKEPLIKGGKRDLITSFSPDELKSLATNLHNVLWGGGGTSDTEIFASLVNIILAKIQDEYDTDTGEKYKFQIFQYGDEIEKPDVLFERINKLYRKALVEQLYVTDDVSDQYVINRQKLPLNKLIYTVGQLEKYSFVDGKSSLNGKDILGDFFEQIQRQGFKQTKGQFFTPINIVRFILYALEIDNLAIDLLNEEGELPYIIDPACGSGTFLIEAMKIITQEIKYRRGGEIKRSRRVQDRFDDLFKPDHKEHRWAREYLYGIEHNFDLGAATKVNMILHGDGSTNIFVKDGLLPFRFYDKPFGLNILDTNQHDSNYKNMEVNAKFDVVVSNPPFSVNLDNRTKNYLESTFLFSRKKNSENLFVERHFQLLRDGGRLGIVLPESVYDTSDNKYIRLFIYKYLFVRGVISIPSLTFEHYTSTKTSLLFAQKKTKEEVEHWTNAWNKYSREWSKLKTRAENYIKVFLQGKKKEKYPSIKNDDETAIRNNLARFLKTSFDEDDSNLEISELLKKYQYEISEIIKFDKDTSDEFGFVNVAWVFEEVAGEFDYTVFMAEAENVGYKRTTRGEKLRPNDLFDLEIAPNNLDLDAVTKRYEDDIEELKAKKENLENELAKEASRKKPRNQEIVILQARIARVREALSSLETEKLEVFGNLEKYYDDKGRLLKPYYTRHDSTLLNVFQLKRMEPFKSEHMLIRKTEHSTILDFLREASIWK